MQNRKYTYNGNIKEKLKFFVVTMGMIFKNFNVVLIKFSIKRSIPNVFPYCNLNFSTV